MSQSAPHLASNLGKDFIDNISYYLLAVLLGAVMTGIIPARFELLLWSGEE